MVSQLNFTKNAFEEAQKVRDEIISNGGTYEEARQAYLELITIPKEVLEQFTLKKIEELENSEESQTEEDSENQTSEETETQ